MIRLRLDYQHIDFLNDVQDIPRAFSPYLIIDENSENYLSWIYSFFEDKFTITISSNLWQKEEKTLLIKNIDLLEYKRKIKRFMKIVLYDYLSEVLQIKLPYGSLTGVRPTKLYYELSKKMEDVSTYLIENLRVFPEKAQLIKNCVNNQKNYINTNKKNVSIFLNIPFCPTRCTYCSFISTEIFRIKNELPFYVDCVKKEIEYVYKILQKNSYNVRTIYVGGGTPTSIGSDFLNQILTELKFFNGEFTVEAGRPDTINFSILDTLKNNNVTRISVNPQTFKQSTLDLIGRKHTVEQIYDTFKLLNTYDFKVNTDLIAGLPQESVDDFIDSVNKSIELAPQNITIHTLSLKRGSIFSEIGKEKEEYGNVSKMIGYGHETLTKAGYLPYYMYRQKNMYDNLENTGYCRDGEQCVYNIDMMEEASSIIGIGAGAMSKKLSNSRIERFSNPKGFREYCERISDIVEKKFDFFAL